MEYAPHLQLLAVVVLGVIPFWRYVWVFVKLISNGYSGFYPIKHYLLYGTYDRTCLLTAPERRRLILHNIGVSVFVIWGARILYYFVSDVVRDFPTR